jgi:hypothetical protein
MKNKRLNDYYLIDGEPGRRFEVLHYNDLTQNAQLCNYLLNQGFDGYLYTLGEIVKKGQFKKTFICVKKENSNFIKTDKVFKL